MTPMNKPFIHINSVKIISYNMAIFFSHATKITHNFLNRLRVQKSSINILKAALCSLEE